MIKLVLVYGKVTAGVRVFITLILTLTLTLTLYGKVTAGVRVFIQTIDQQVDTVAINALENLEPVFGPLVGHGSERTRFFYMLLKRAKATPPPALLRLLFALRQFTSAIAFVLLKALLLASCASHAASLVGGSPSV